MKLQPWLPKSLRRLRRFCMRLTFVMVLPVALGADLIEAIMIICPMLEHLARSSVPALVATILYAVATTAIARRIYALDAGWQTQTNIEVTPIKFDICIDGSTGGLAWAFTQILAAAATWALMCAYRCAHLVLISWLASPTTAAACTIT